MELVAEHLDRQVTSNSVKIQLGERISNTNPKYQTILIV